jgi:hypothetical protein
MKNYGYNGEVQEVLSRLESTLEAYLEAWRKEFGMGERPAAGSGKKASPHARRATMHSRRSA